MRLLLVLCFAGALAGCFNPRVKNFGFACTVGDRGSCPAGSQCVAGYCDNGSGGVNPGIVVSNADLSVAPPGDLAQAASSDLAHTGSSPDLSRPVADMSQPASPPDLLTCKPDNAPCSRSTDCCSGHCHLYTTGVCFTL